jgi:hypothetical protein
MKSSRITIIAGLAAVSLLTLSLPVGASGDEIEGMILSRGGDALTVSGSSGRTTVLLSANTRVKDDKGLFGLDRQEMAATILIPGLRFEWRVRRIAWVSSERRQSPWTGMTWKHPK